MTIRTEHKGYQLQQVALRNDTMLASDGRKWSAIYKIPGTSSTVEGIGETPENAVAAARLIIDREVDPTGARFCVPCRVAGELTEDYLYRVVQEFERWVNAQEWAK